MTTIRRIVTSKIDGSDANNTTDDEIRPFGEINVYIDNNNADKLVLAIHDGVRTHLKSKVLEPGVFYGSGDDSGDGAGLDTIKLIPDSELHYNSGSYGNDQYIIVDPTGGDPGHIHLRAGGTQDASTADLYLGGELTCVRVSDTSGIVTVRTTNVGDPNITLDWSFQSDGNLYFPGIGNNRIGESEPGLVVSSDNSVVLQSNNTGESKELTFGPDGSLVFPSGAGQINPQVSDGPGLQVEADGDFEIKVADSEDTAIWSFEPSGSISFPDGSVQTTAYTGSENGTVTGIESEDAVEIRVNLTDSTTRIWRFGEDGNLTFPETVLGETPEEGTFPKIEFPIPGFGNTAGTIGSGPFGLEITVLDNTWGFTPSFGGGGFLTLPGEGVIRSNDDTVVLQSYDTTFNVGKGIRIGTNGYVYFELGDDPAYFQIEEGEGDAQLVARTNLTIMANGGSTIKQWTFNTNGSLTFPDSTVQTTAWTGTGTADTGNITFDDNTIQGNTLGTVGTQITVNSNYLGATTQNSNVFNLSKTADTDQVQIGWIIRGSGGGPQTITNKIDSGSYWSFYVAGGISTTYPITIESSDYQLGGGAQLILAVDPGDSSVKSWTFDSDGSVTFPDASTQTTAYTGNAATVDITNTNGIDTNYSITFVENRDGAEILRADVDLTFNSATNTLTAGNFSGDGSTLTGVATKTSGEWAVTSGTNTYSFTVPGDGTYIMWVKGNIPNGIITWNATASVSNTNVPAIGTQYAWNYTGGGSPILLTSIPDQIKGVAGTISTDATYAGTTSNRFDFGISNTSGSTQTIYYGYTKIS
jgi:hypothetical protein